MEVVKGGKGKHARVKKHPGVKGRRPDNYEFRKTEAQERQAAYDQLSVQEKLARLPVGGAKKQRARLEAQVNQPSAKEESK